MAVLISKKRSKPYKKFESREKHSLYDSFLARFLFRLPFVTLIFILLCLWSSSTTIISGNIVHVCVSSRRLNNLYCLSAGTKPSFELPIPVVNESVSINYHVDNEIMQVVDPISETGILKFKNSEVEEGMRSAEEQMKFHRSFSPSNNQGNCSGRGVFVYDLPSKFNKDLLAQCDNMTPWVDFCTYFTNQALGEPLLELGDGWYQTHQYALEPIFHSRVLKHPCRVYNQDEAILFYVPYYGGLDVLRWHFKNVSNDVKDNLSHELVKWLGSQRAWVKNNGKDHAFVLGKISWDFRRRINSKWGTRLLNLEQMQNPIKLLIERQPWELNDVGIPHPTHFHPKSDNDILAWQLKIMTSKRKKLVSFAGAARPGAPTSIRSILIDQCTKNPTKCGFLNCIDGGCDKPSSVIGLFTESEFCLQPPGDSPTRKSVFDSLVSGCIPVLFDPFTTYYQYPWHLPEEYKRYSAFIDQEDVRDMKVNVVERLMNVSEIEREDMRRYIVYELLPGLVYGDLDSKLEKFQDAFSLTMSHLLERVSRL